MAKTVFTNKKAIRLSIAILAGLILGALFGLIMPDWAEPITSFISTVYLHGLTMMIYPLVFCSLIVGIKGIGSVSATGKVGGQALLYFIGTTLFASLLGLFLPKALGIGTGVTIEMAEAEIEAAEFTSVLDTLKNIIPSNPFASFVNGNMLQVLAFAIIIGITCLLLGSKADPFLKLCESINVISVKIISAVMYTTPVGVFCSLAGTVHVNGIKTILSLAAVLGALYLVMFLYIVIVYGVVIVKAIGKFSIKQFFITVLPAALNAFGTASSSATLPISKRCADDMDVPNEISSLALPLGATINMDAVSIVMSFMVVFFANATGTNADRYNLIIAILIAVIIVMGMNLVGSLLISALVIFPALSAMRLYNNYRGVVICSAVIAVICAVTGMLLSILLSTPVGATIVTADIVVFAAVSLIKSFFK